MPLSLSAADAAAFVKQLNVSDGAGALPCEPDALLAFTSCRTSRDLGLTFIVDSFSPISLVQFDVS